MDGLIRAFDDVRVARAVASSKVPVATAVGHARNVSLADVDATWAFITPSAAGEEVATVLSRQKGGAVKSRRIANAERTAEAYKAVVASQHVKIENLRARLNEDHDRMIEVRKMLGILETRINKNDRDHADRRFTDAVLLDAARARVRSRSRWLAVGGLLAIYVALVLANAGGVWLLGGLGGVCLATGFVV